MDYEIKFHEEIVTHRAKCQRSVKSIQQFGLRINHHDKAAMCGKLMLSAQSRVVAISWVGIDAQLDRIFIDFSNGKATDLN